jgi:hypothetical protein
VNVLSGGSAAYVGPASGGMLNVSAGGTAHNVTVSSGGRHLAPSSAARSRLQAAASIRSRSGSRCPRASRGCRRCCFGLRRHVARLDREPRFDRGPEIMNLDLAGGAIDRHFGDPYRQSVVP